MVVLICVPFFQEWTCSKRRQGEPQTGTSLYSRKAYNTHQCTSTPSNGKPQAIHCLYHWVNDFPHIINHWINDTIYFSPIIGTNLLDIQVRSHQQPCLPDHTPLLLRPPLVSSQRAPHRPTRFPSLATRHEIRILCMQHSLAHPPAKQLCHNNEQPSSHIARAR